MIDRMKTADLVPRMTSWRRDIHAHPELGFEERRTSAKVAELLTSFGVDVECGVGGTGVVGVLQRGNGTARIGLRADMDALPIRETNEFAHRSAHSGVMHACGHDGHSAMLLGAAQHLAQSGNFSGKAVFIFQPNEEHGHGATAMIDDGLFGRFDVDEIYGMHNIPGMALGTFATRPGTITASESLFEICVEAQGGHAALPHMGVDAIVVGAELVGALQTIVARKLDPSLSGVVSVTEFITDGSRNVLPGKLRLKGDARALLPGTNTAIEAKMRQIVAGTSAAHGVAAEVIYETVFPPTINAGTQAKIAAEVAAGLVGQDHVDGKCLPKFFSEDFAHFAAARPGCFVLMGNGTAGAHARPLHSSDYDFCDDALVCGASFWVALVERQLQ